jgi:hypothetical protein
MEHKDLNPADYSLWKPADLTQKAAMFGWDSPLVQNAIGANVQKAVGDSTSVSPLIRQDLEPEIYTTFVKQFPFFDMVAKEEANGLVHAFNQQTAFSQNSEDTPVTIAENGTVADDTNTYVRKTTNIGIFATRRGASLKSTFAVRAGGAPYGDPASRELSGGLTKIAHDVQAELFRMHNDVAHNATVATDPLGLYDANGFNGLRYTLQNLTPVGNSFQTIVTGSWTDTRVIKALRMAANAVIDQGGSPDMVVCSVQGKEDVILDVLPQVRFNNMVEVIPGLRVEKIAAGESELPLITIPGKSIGSYVVPAAQAIPAGTYVDMYVLDSSTLSIPWLGGASPTVLEIPIGTDGQLRKLFIPFAMYGFACHVPQYLARVQLQIA